MSPVNPRRPASSRTPVARPRRVAGQGGTTAALPATDAPDVVEPEVVEAEGVEPAVTEREFVEPSVVEPSVVEPSVVELGKAEPEDDGPADATAAAPIDDEPEPDPAPERRGLRALFDSRRVTVVLATLIVLLGLVAGGLAIRQAVQDPQQAELKPPPEGEIAVPQGRPVMIDGEDATAAAAAAADAATAFFTRTADDYDKQVDEATALMTDDFAATFRKTTDDVKDAFVADKTEVEVRVVAQSIVRANRSQAQSLLFLNQYVSKNGGDTTYTPYRVLVTMVHTDRGWLVSDLDTK